MSVSLNNKRILVTRPRHQAERLCALVTNNGGQAILFPTIDIQRVKDSVHNKLILDDVLSGFDIVIFVSRNAVKFAFDHHLSTADLSNDIQFVAIGAGTAEAFSEWGDMPVLHAGVHADSETLLQLPEMQKDRLAGKKILIIRGVGGREYLADNLISRGAFVDYAEVYRRCLPEYEMNDCHKIWQDIKPEAIIVSSNEGLANLVSLTSELDQLQLFSTPLVLMSARSVNLAKQSGFVSKMSIAKVKNDEGLLLALLDLVGEQ